VGGFRRRMKSSRDAVPLVLVAILSIGILGCQPKPSLLRKEPPSFLIQDISRLKDTNGKIVEQRVFRVDSEFKNRIDCFKIEYLSDGLRVVGFIVKPAQIESGLPVILFNRGGGLEYGNIAGENLIYLSYLASKGYILIASQYRGNSGGEGREEFGGKDVDDVLNLIPLAKSLPFTDPSRIGMLGFSRGGMMTYLAIKEGVPIKAAAVVGGLSNLLQFFEGKGKDKMKYVIRELVGPDIEEYRKRSANDWPERINVPVLILHGEKDRVVDVTQAKKLGERMKASEKPHELVIFPNGDHGLNNLRSQRDRIILEWFERYLKTEPIPRIPLN
jgi:dipeptidyl aminopeptidase/acylaminoacyl peptidase